ncbi:MAG TPA: cytochrome c3 family protein [Thermodesulfovibrionales bacterium]|nr:cytochrome c3 family protein [Thermodesulfovibrionales bacterium]
MRRTPEALSDGAIIDRLLCRLVGKPHGGRYRTGGDNKQRCRYYAVFGACLVILFIFAGGSTAEESKKIHGECSTCHKGEDHKAIKSVINETCNRCHPTTSGKDHPVDVVPEVKPPDLPLGEGNRITCVTCHEPHGKNTVEKLLRKKYRSLCTDCHKD